MVTSGKFATSLHGREVNITKGLVWGDKYKAQKLVAQTRSNKQMQMLAVSQQDLGKDIDFHLFLVSEELGQGKRSLRTRSLIRMTTRKLVANTRSKKAIQAVVFFLKEAPGEFMNNSGVVTY